MERKPIKPISKRRPRKSKPWFNRDLWRLREEFHGAERKWLKGKIKKRKYIRSRNEYKREVEKVKHAFEKDLYAELGPDMIIGKWVKNGVVTDFIFKFCEKCLIWS